MKLEVKDIKDVSIILSLIATIVGGAVYTARATDKIKQVDHQVTEVKEGVDVIKRDVEDNSRINFQQTVILDSVTKRLEKIE